MSNMKKNDNEVVPNIFIVGAAKAGTSYFTDILNSHPDVYVPFFQEPQFLARDFSAHINLKTFEEYLSLYEGRSEKFLIDGSTTYLYSEVASQEIFKLNPNAKIIILLREPIARLTSQFNFQVRNGKECRDIDSAVLYSLVNSSDLSGWSFSYYPMSEYSSQVKRYYDVFASEQIKIVIFESFIKNTKSTLVDVCDFLDLDYDNIDFNAKHAKNGSNKPIFPALNNFLSSSVYLKRIFKKIVPWVIRRKVIWNIHKFNQTNEKIDNRICIDLKYKLAPYFSEDIRKLSIITGIDFSKYWKNYD